MALEIFWPSDPHGIHESALRSDEHQNCFEQKRYYLKRTISTSSSQQNAYRSGFTSTDATSKLDYLNHQN
ncbi:hypothetical protein ACMD2_18743 [Ananas comosus]|uniref:Uncharacterized protein n=1 Tax=Ananas comosus TaxID=4615 RepID=A0A199W4L6_ANACO|nr:hypothetical protein ACMD2_18743 [Ananas comosus]